MGNLNINSFALDVEGYEYKVLEGYDEKTKIINYLIVEADLEEFKLFAEPRGWKYIRYLAGGSNANYLFKLRRKRLINVPSCYELKLILRNYHAT